MFSTAECAWANVTIKLLGRTINGLRGFEFDKEKELEYLYAAGDEPIDLQSGQKKYEGNLKLLKYEVDLLNDAALDAGFEDILEVPHEAIVITCTFKKRATDKTRTIIAAGVGFSKMTMAMDLAAKMTEVTMPFKAMKKSFR